jgi:hypothetical protein
MDHDPGWSLLVALMGLRDISLVRFDVLRAGRMKSI